MRGFAQDVIDHFGEVAGLVKNRELTVGPGAHFEHFEYVLYLVAAAEVVKYIIHKVK